MTNGQERNTKNYKRAGNNTKKHFREKIMECLTAPE